MTYPTIEELKRIQEADPYIEAALEFVWAFTDWWETVEEDDMGRVHIDTEAAHAMEQAYERWRNLR